MKIKIVLMLLIVLLFSGSAQSQEAMNVGNKICPVTGEKIGEMGKPAYYEYKGKVYNLCCEGCVETFKENPEKYINNVETSMSKEKTDQGHQHMGEEGSSM